MNGDEGAWRHELKYVCTLQQLAVIAHRIRPLLKPDPHARGGSYAIRSVYFDDVKDRCFYENQDGTDPREKFRIRIYNGSAARIALELKQKRQGMTRKLSCLLTKEQCGQILRGELRKDWEAMPPLLCKFALQQRKRGLSAKVIVEYDRTPYVLRQGNVRITLDKNITSSDAVTRFLEGDYPKRPVMPQGLHVLEVKYDAFLPDFVRQTLQLETLQRTSFSKFYECRRRGSNGISGYL